MASESAKKGRALETAVKLIQEAILEADPQTRGSRFSIETNRLETVSGVRHEIDVFVKTLPGSDYEASWIFECKNWRAPVDKNEVIVFSEKVEAVRANRGFLVAKALTKDAEAQLALQPRLRFIPCSDDFLSCLSGAEVVHSVIDVLPITIKIKQRGVPPSDHPRTLDWKALTCRLNNRPLDFRSFVKSEVDRLVREAQDRNAAEYQYEGIHWGQNDSLVEFADGELSIDDMEVEYLVIPIKFFIRVCVRKVVSKFELQGKGRAFGFEPIDLPESGMQLNIHLVERL